MKRFVFVAALTLTTLAASLTPAYAQTTPNVTVPVVGTGTAAAFTGAFTLKRFVATPTGVAAVGTLSGIVTPTGGVPQSIYRIVTVPVAAEMAPASGPQIAASCGILHLDLGPLFLDLLGLQVDLSRIVLDITAQTGPNNLLGNLLCAVTGLLDQPGGLARLLNAILGILG